MQSDLNDGKKRVARAHYVRAIGPRLRVLLFVVLALVAVLSANSVYLVSIRLLEWWANDPAVTYQNWFYMVMFGLHLALGLILILPLVVFGVIHMINARNRPRRRAVQAGYLLFAVSLAVLVTGVLLMRADVFHLQNLGIKDPRLRSITYWLHVALPFVVVWLFILHRLAGPRLQWKHGLRWGIAVVILVTGMVGLHSTHPRARGTEEAQSEQPFAPSPARTASGEFIPARTLMMDDYCLQCHEDAYQGWFHSAHHFSSFNNPPYLFSVRETRRVAMERDGNVTAARWCAGCHDLVPLFSGAFDDPEFDDVNHPTANAGITCTACHAITAINSTRGNGDYTIDAPIHYPFAYSTNKLLQYVNQQLVKAKPAFHNRTFLKPFMQTPEFCSTCHKVSLPAELTRYKEFLRGQNHYDSFLLSGVSGHGARSFYYPEVAVQKCADCHMPLQASQDFGAIYLGSPGASQGFIHDHLFPAANTGIAHLRGDQETVNRHTAFLEGTLRVDIIGLKAGGTIDAPLIAPLRPQVPALRRGERYLLEVVLRTLKLGHHFTQGTVDSNEIWVDTVLTGGDRVLGRSGGLGPHREVDPWAYFVNVFMLDRDGYRVDRRNAQDIFTPLYNHQIPPGAARIVHYEFTVPEDQSAPLTVEVKLNYRKFDTIYMNYILDPDYTRGAPLSHTNDLPIVTIAADRITFPILDIPPSGPAQEPPQTSPVPEWQRWNDYGIGLLLESGSGAEKGQLIQAADAFEQVEALGRPDGPLNLARVYFREGRLDEAAAAVQRAARFDPPAPRWTVAWLSGLVHKQYGRLDQAISEFRSILEDRYPELDERGLDFSLDYVVINELGQTYHERAKMARANAEQRETFLRLAVAAFEQTLELDTENLTAHYGLAQVCLELGETEKAEHHRLEHEKYLPDYNAQDRAVAIARRSNPAADHAAQATAIYPLQREGAPTGTP